MLYALTDILVYPTMYYLVRYRRKIVRQNLSYLLSVKPDADLHAIEKAYYHRLSDMIAEVIYGYSCPQEEMRKRVVFDGFNQTEATALRKQGAIYLLGHMGNWEWLADFANRIEAPEIKGFSVYRTQKSGEDLIEAIREKRGGGLVDKNILLRHMIRMRQSGIVPAYGILADQKPSKNNLHFWTTFLGQDTPFLNGTDVLARRLDYAVYYVHIVRVKRGYYKVDLRLITDDAASTPKDYIVEQYARMLEENILEQPEIWLWSHNRFKWTRECVAQS